MKYVKKPVVVEAFRVGYELTPTWFYNSDRHISTNYDDHEGNERLYLQSAIINTLEGIMKAHKGDYIIKGIKDEIYPCKADIFEATYEPLNEEEPMYELRCSTEMDFPTETKIVFNKEKGVFLPITKDQLLSALYGIGGTIKARADYKDQAWNLVQELIGMVEND